MLLLTTITFLITTFMNLRQFWGFMATRSDLSKDVKLITKAKVRSDHRIVVSKIKIDTYCERKIVKTRKYM